MCIFFFSFVFFLFVKVIVIVIPAIVLAVLCCSWRGSLGSCEKKDKRNSANVYAIQIYKSWMKVGEEEVENRKEQSESTKDVEKVKDDE